VNDAVKFLENLCLIVLFSGFLGAMMVWCLFWIWAFWFAAAKHWKARRIERALAVSKRETSLLPEPCYLCGEPIVRIAPHSWVHVSTGAVLCGPSASTTNATISPK